MRVVFLDVNPETLHIGLNQLEQCLAEDREEETALLADHTFGYPFAQLPEVRRKHPRLLIIEDCVRALGSRIHGRPVGNTGDWTLLSMYKTTPGNNHGAILLTQSPYQIHTGPSPITTWGTWRRWVKQWASISPALRMLWDFVHPDYGPTRRDVEAVVWHPERRHTQPTMSKAV